MSDSIKIRNWDKWQSYRKDRGQPPWIKIHRSLMRDPNWVALSDAERGQLVSIWMLAADKNGHIPSSPELIRKLCFMNDTPNMEMFDKHGFLDGWRQDDVKTTSRRRQYDAPDKNRVEKNRIEENITDLIAKDATPPTPQASFVLKFKETYEAMTGQPFNALKSHYVIASRLIKAHGLDAVVLKVKTLGALCRDRSTWFTSGGWADFSIEKLSSRWNEIIPGVVPLSKEDKEKREEDAIREKVREANERTKRALDS